MGRANWWGVFVGFLFGRRFGAAPGSVFVSSLSVKTLEVWQHVAGGVARIQRKACQVYSPASFRHGYSLRTFFPANSLHATDVKGCAGSECLQFQTMVKSFAMSYNVHVQGCLANLYVWADVWMTCQDSLFLSSPIFVSPSLFPPPSPVHHWPFCRAVLWLSTARLTGASCISAGRSAWRPQPGSWCDWQLKVLDSLLVSQSLLCSWLFISMAARKKFEEKDSHACVLPFVCACFAW